MKTRLSILLLISLFLSGCGATAPPTATLVQSTPTALAPQEPTSTASIVTATVDTATIIVTAASATPEATMTPQATATIQQLQMEMVSDGQQTAPPPPVDCQRPQNWVAYTVARNDTLSSLGQRTGTTWQRIQSANCLPSTTIFAGQRLYVPFIPAPPPAFTDTIEIPEAPAPGNPHVSVKSATTTIPTIYTFEIRDFTAGEFVTVKVWPVGATAALASFRVRIGDNGNLDFPWISQSGNPIGNYFVIVANDDESHKAVGEFVVE